jgi:hypothetical protein
VAISITGPSFGATDGATAIRANDFLNTIGVCTHMAQGEDAPAKVAQCLAYIGIRVVREDGTANQRTLRSFINVHKESGVKFDLLPINGHVAESVQMYELMAGEGALLAAEGPNEPNNWHVTYNGASSSKKTSMAVALFQRDLYAAVKADAKLAGIPVFHSSEAGGSEPDNCGLQFLTIPAGAGTLLPPGTRFADYANTHNYVCGHNLKGVTLDNIAWQAEDPTLNGEWDGLYVEYGHTWSGKGFRGYSKAELEALPRVTTETGWTTRSPKPAADAKDTKDEGIPEADQGKLFLNLYLDAVKRGWSCTVIYMLHDSVGQSSWGFVHHDYSHKPSAVYLHNMTTILADKSSAFTPGKVNYSIPAKPATVHDMLMQKSDGTFELAVWGERAKGSDDVIVNLGAAYPSVKVYDPTVGVEPTQTLSNVNSVPLTLSDHPVIIELAPASR